ncbi:unnamed protein product [Cylindrotheca closterium]|uniref:USP8 dimerisation domain-containing protein n=1 Tax=Cylindrotheca closterium TaxID=2856 RepID=A0AAD2FIB8_9STRA|nr:unnamed protein product [Cylindrotheca closterium]
MANQAQSKRTDRPSSNRRNHLKEADGSSGNAITVSNLFPIDRYYDASQKVLNAFQVSFEEKKLDDAYVYGMRYSRFCVNEITKHDYYKATKFNQKRAVMNKQVTEVINKLEIVADMMDAEEVIKEAERKARFQRQKEEEARRRQEKLQELQQRVNRQKHSAVVSSPTISAESIHDSALAKLQRLNGPVEPPAVSTSRSPSQSMGENTESELEDSQQDPDGLIASSDDIPPPLLPPQPDDEPEHSAPPSYQDIVNYFGPSNIQSTSIEESDKPQNKKAAPKTKLSIRQYIANAERARLALQQQRKILVSPLQTYQGRVRGSTNGCTVISATIASKHLETHGGVSDAHICDIIDKECIPLLRDIRSRLGLHGDSLIIPSDVHDHMVDHHLLFQHKFVGAVGGNIVDREHLGELFSLLAGKPDKTAHFKAGATFFFREHVVSILKFPTSPTEAVYDLVDSLPTCNGRGSRTRCMSLEALKVQMEWYTSHKFSDSNCTYIEKNKWNDSMADFDPRVFQAFVWANLPKPSN